MKKQPLVLFLLLLLTAAPALGQAAFESERVGHGGFIGPVFKASTMNDETAQLLGFRGGWILNLEGGHSFILGGGAYGVMNDVNARGVIVDGDDVHLGLDYAGIELGYRHRTLRWVHFSVQTLIGAGGVDYRDIGDAFSDDDSGDGFFVLEPGVSMTLNVLRFARLGGGVSYRYINGVRLLGATNEDLSGVSWEVSLQLGRF